MAEIANPKLIACLSRIIENLRNVEIDPRHKFELEWIISAYRRVFDDKYVVNRDGTINRDDIIAEEIEYPLFGFLNQHHCCWIDFIGQESFSSAQAKQVFFSTVSMKKEDSERRKLFIDEYNNWVNQGWSADIFVQLFLQRYEIIDKELSGQGSDAGTNSRIKEYYGHVRDHGLLICFEKPARSQMHEIPSVVIPCESVNVTEELHFERVPNRPLATEIKDFMLTLGEHEGNPPVQSPLVNCVATLNRSLHGEVKYLYFLPVHSAKQTIGLCCFGSKQELNRTERENLSILAYNILSPFISAYQSAWEKEQIVRESIISSISSIMSRNMSHNLGSHVLSALSNPQEATYRFNEDAPYRGLFEIREKNKDAFHQISNLITYLRFRMDYISDISFRPPSSLVTRLFYNQMLAELDRNRLLLNHISGLGKHFVYRFRFINRVEISAEEKNDVSVAIPNDVIGTHALFNLTENVIRNAAKHGNSSGHENIFTFVVSEPTDPDATDMYEIWLYHNDELSIGEADDLAWKLNEFIDRDVIEKSGKRREALGIVEMKASAAFLRQEDIKKVSTQYECAPKLLEAIVIPSDTDERYHVAYKFFLLKPRDYVRIVGEDAPFQQGKHLMPVSELISKIEKRQVFNQDFLVYDDDLADTMEKLMPEYRTAMPLRVLRTSQFQGKEVNWDNCWKTWERLHDGSWPINTFAGDYDSTIIPETYAVILSHAGEDKDQDGADKKKPFKVLVENKKDLVYLEGLSSYAARRLPGCYGADDLTPYVGKLRTSFKRYKEPEYCICREMVNTHVFIVDERIQDAAYDRSCYEVPLIEHYRLCGISIPSREQVDLRSQEFNAPLCDKLLTIIGEQVRHVDFVLIHYGILERIFKTKETRLHNWHQLMRQQVDSWTSEGPAQIVVESGRGVPADLPTSVRFISNSSIFSAVVEEKSKMMLNILLYSSRRTVL